MKHLLKGAGLLILDQVMSVFVGIMFVPCVAMFFKNSLFLGYVVAFICCFAFYVYVSYITAFKKGFHDSHRAIKDLNYRGYLYKGALAGLIAAIPLIAVYIFYLVTGAGIVRRYFMIFNMFFTWPMFNIFPNHVPAIMILAFVPLIIVPWLGYIAGYRNFLFADLFAKLYNKWVPERPEK